MKWYTIDSAPKDGDPFLAWYSSKFGPPFGTMKWEEGVGKKEGRFHSMTIGTQTKCATHWAVVGGPQKMLTENQKKTVLEAIGDGTDWPKFTNDPEVNCAVDVAVCDMKPWDELSKEEKETYKEEVKLL